jgi:membrane associated rhomboid family serine protease
MSQPTLDGLVAAGPPSKSEGSAPLTLLACAIAIAVTIGITAESADPSWARMAKWGHLPAERIWDGALWALVTSAFVHVALWHLVFNVYWLWRFGGAVERELGSFRFLVFVVAVAFLGSAFQLAASGGTGIGASGIVYGLFGFMWRSKEKVPRFAEILGPDTASFFFIWLIACLVATQAGFVSIANAAHFTGLSFGVLVAEWRNRGSHRRLAVVAMALLCVLSLLATRSNPWSVRWLQHHAMKMHRAHQYEVAALAYERSLSFGADSAWAFHNLALTYYSLGDSTRCADALRRLRGTAPAEADSLEPRLLGADFSRGAHD